MYTTQSYEVEAMKQMRDVDAAKAVMMHEARREDGAAAVQMRRRSWVRMPAFVMKMRRQPA